MATKKPAKKTATKAPKKVAKKATIPKKAVPAKKAAKKIAKKAPAKKPATKAAPKTSLPVSSGSPHIAGNKAPAISLPGSDGKTHTLAQHAGKQVVVYFYPRDDTPGCTVEACDFRDNMSRVAAAGAVVYGVSKDSVASHQKFIAKYGLNFVLLSDPELVVHRAFGAFGKKSMYGKIVEGTIRSTFLIGADGTVKKAWPKVSVKGHVDDVLASL
jgi:thioredoxin-dependent peroxiredoxin